MKEALALLEVDSVARGLRCLDALVKKAPVEVLEANLIEPGRYLILISGGVAEVEESHVEAMRVASDSCVADMLLPMAHPDLVAGLRGREDHGSPLGPDTLGVIEGTQVASTLEACDRSLKEAAVSLAGVRVAGGLGGRAYYVVHGLQHDVEAAIDSGSRILCQREALYRTECIARPHPDMTTWLLRPAPFQVG